MMPRCMMWFVALCLFNMVSLVLYLSFQERGFVVLLGLIGGIFWRSFSSIMPHHGPSSNFPHAEYNDYTYYNR